MRSYPSVNNVNLTGGAIIILLILYTINRETYHKLYQKINSLEAQAAAQAETQSLNAEYSMVNTDDLKMKNMLQPPLMRNYHTDPNGVKMMPINVETRESGGDYQQVGMLYKDTIIDEDKAPGNNTDSNILPLFGKPVYKGSQQWNYYTATDKYNQIKIPLSINNTNCTDDRGCKEIMDTEQIAVPGYNGNFKVQIYKFDSPKYIPYV
jgi:hypothetical protein